jgi:hypothetical protein
MNDQSSTPHTHYHLGNHGAVLEQLCKTHQGKVAACIFNLGYLPGGDKTITTTQSNTLRALEATSTLLAPGGILSIVCYPGHPEGAAEAAAVSAWAEKQKAANLYKLEAYQNTGTMRPGPYLLWLVK